MTDFHQISEYFFLDRPKKYEEKSFSKNIFFPTRKKNRWKFWLFRKIVIFRKRQNFHWFFFQVGKKIFVEKLFSIDFFLVIKIWYCTWQLHRVSTPTHVKNDERYTDLKIFDFWHFFFTFSIFSLGSGLDYMNLPLHHSSDTFVRKGHKPDKKVH